MTARKRGKKQAPARPQNRIAELKERARRLSEWYQYDPRALGAGAVVPWTQDVLAAKVGMEIPSPFFRALGGLVGVLALSRYQADYVDPMGELDPGAAEEEIIEWCQEEPAEVVAALESAVEQAKYFWQVLGRLAGRFETPTRAAEELSREFIRELERLVLLKEVLRGLGLLNDRWLSWTPRLTRLMKRVRQSPDVLLGSDVYVLGSLLVFREDMDPEAEYLDVFEAVLEEVEAFRRSMDATLTGYETVF